MKLFRNKPFIKGLAYDLVGMATVAIPVVGPGSIMGTLRREEDERDVPWKKR